MTYVSLIMGWLGVVALALFSPDPDSLTTPLLWAWLAAIVAVIAVAAFGVLHHAEVLARRLGDPYGTLVLTISIVAIEVTLIAAVLFGPGDHTTVARDATMAAAMLFLGLGLGVAVLIATLRHGSLRFNPRGLSSYLTMLTVFGALAFVVPGLIGENGSYGTGQAIVVILMTAGAYAFFLWRQTGAQATDFQEVEELELPEETSGTTPTWLHGVLLFITAVPIVILSHDMASLLDVALTRANAPLALSGIAIATIVMLPEVLTTMRAAWNGEIQRVSNLTHGAMVSVVGLTIPVVLTIGLLTGQEIVFAESPTHIVLLLLLALISVAVLAGRRVTPVHGIAHLVITAAYLMSVFA